ncbi:MULTISPECIES: FadR/GntR family transcriptional regulator [Desulfitobacterium]|uniref:Transcriptional regulator n=1 Tax=Desulfitobacterium dehalogenans (strain ATCC 51507 / DSM 9161 / JW/IU-DC1) TaxID=756499 RepID=I4A8J9_DESDJ|nr:MULTISPECIES: FadR/GntR family transcriptional regulator [Desulfitobacterium]AFM00284.1 transcriptional regulator [Desulfitobacterium dehalogenans ATCC 51507]
MILRTKALLSIPEQIAEIIKDNIITGQLKLGDRLPGEIELAEQLGVSRSTLREALDLLEEQQIIYRKQGKQGGSFITKRTTEDVVKYLMNYLALSVGLHSISIENIYEMRMIVEVKGCGLAALRRTDEDLEAMYAALLPLDDLVTPYHFHHNDIIFHKAMAQATHNELMIIYMSLFTKVQEVIGFNASASKEVHQSLVRNLKNIYQAILDQDQERAEKLMVDHIDFFKTIPKGVRI